MLFLFYTENKAHSLTENTHADAPLSPLHTKNPETKDKLGDLALWHVVGRR